jgi:hypothetical protein
MKPLNLDNRPCSPVSSNCVVWQGPTLDCIDLCTGDTISDVVAKMAEELCTLLDQTNVDNYDLTCLGITACGPKDFQALIQLLIEKICELNDIPTDTTRSETDCPSCIVDIAQCFIQQTGQITMPLVDYVKMIAEKVCGLVSTINNIQNEINNLTIRVEILENTPPPTVQIPTVNFSCPIGTLLAGQPYNVDVALQTYINSVWCPMSTALGTPSELIASYTIPCAFGPDITTNANWTGSPTTLADSVTNIWIVLCELYSVISSISLNVQDTNTVDLTFASGVLTANIQDTGWEPLNGFDHYAPGVDRPQCRRIGNQIHFRGVVVIPLDNPTAPGNVVSYTSTSYNSVAGCQVFTGGGGVLTNANGNIQFNNGTSVIPASILNPYVSALNPGTNLDGTYGMGYVVATRQIDVDATYGTALSSLFNVGITFDKKLYIAVLKDLELSNTRNNALQLGSSHLRYVTSNVRTGEHVPNFISPFSTVHSSPNSGIVTTTTIPLPPPLASDTQYETLNNLRVDYNTGTFVYPFNCDAGDEEQIGGFAFRLDGLMAYVNPCTTDIKTYICKGPA